MKLKAGEYKVSDVVHEISVVIPIFQAEKTISSLVDEILNLAEITRSSGGNEFVVSEIILVHDNGPDNSDRVLRELEERIPIVRVVWLSRNFGQHAATMAGMTSTQFEWIATLDEDGQHNPQDIGFLLDSALDNNADIVYGKPKNPPPHGILRNMASRTAKLTLSAIFGSREALNFQSYRMVRGRVGRTVAAYAGAGVYLDVALSWVGNRTSTAPITLRQENGRRSGYSLRKLISHYLRMVISSGTRGLRLVSALGGILGVVGLVYAFIVIAERLSDPSQPQGWASIVTLVLLTSGAILFSIGIIAEYLGNLLEVSLGRPAYVITAGPSDPRENITKSSKGD